MAPDALEPSRKMNAQTPLWTPSPERIAASNMTAFMKLVNDRHGAGATDYASLHAWSVATLNRLAARPCAEAG